MYIPKTIATDCAFFQEENCRKLMAGIVLPLEQKIKEYRIEHYKVVLYIM